MPDPYVARETIWVPYMKDVLLVDELFDEDSGFVLLVDYTSRGQISVLK